MSNSEETSLLGKEGHVPQYASTEPEPEKVKDTSAGCTCRASYSVAGIFIALLAIGTIAGVTVYATLRCGPVNRSPPPIVQSAENGRRNEVQRILKDNGDSVNEQDCDGTTALIVAVRKGDTELVGMLLDSGADPDIQGEAGYTALVIAVISNYQNITSLLIEKGANLNLRDDFGETALHHAAWEGNVAIGEQLLEAGANPNSRERFGEVPLVKAAYRGWTQFVRLLIQYGADVNALDLVSQPMTPSAKHVFFCIIAWHNMLSGLAQTGETPLHNAAARGHLEIAMVLLDAGTSPITADINDQNAFDVATTNHHAQVAVLIQSYISHYRDEASGTV